MELRTYQTPLPRTTGLVSGPDVRIPLQQELGRATRWETHGSESERVAPVTANPRSLPDLMYPTDCNIGVNDACTCRLSGSGQ